MEREERKLGSAEGAKGEGQESGVSAAADRQGGLFDRE